VKRGQTKKPLFIFKDLKIKMTPKKSIIEQVLDEAHEITAKVIERKHRSGK
jgi:hypothetical protein